MRTLFIVCLFLVSASSRAQPLTDTQKLASLAKLWGFLKYYHPAVAPGKRDWDQQLMALLPAVQQAADKQALSAVYGQLLDELGPVKSCRNCPVSESGQRNLDLAFLSDSLVFTPDLQGRLTYLIANRYQGKPYYVQQPAPQSGFALSFDNEKLYENLHQPGRGTAAEPCRLLALFRYWNVIQYFFPYKYAVDGSWNDVLTDLIPVFRQATTEEAYQGALYQLTSRINDSHAFMQNVDKTRCLRCEWGKLWLPFEATFLDRQLVVTRRFNDSLNVPTVVTAGTVIHAIDGEPIPARVERLRPFIAASNEGALLRDLRWLIGVGTNPEARLTIRHNGRDTVVLVPRYPYPKLGRAIAAASTAQQYPVSQWLADSVGYVNMGKLTTPQVDSVMQPLQAARALLVDLRNYPKGTLWLISRYLTDEPVPFVRFTRANLRFPGTFASEKPTRLPHLKGKAYRGKLIVLVDAETQSQAEFTAMAFRSVPGTLLVGSPTAGADGNIAWVPLPGGYRTAFSGIGVYYPDGRETQRVGIVPDVLVTPTPAGIRAGRDEVLERALQLIQRTDEPLR
ncbi:peptidase S41 [Fibrella aestuarina BUZ 2]|uniref:Peptidase S41 n=1 Tax=Fibrella aestuarina BUZ 2 TaxID=1166018 RepID=I0KDU9_9BACT|nr:S41 family peptidase [Fibrella aestuarina]CCH02302.1 peptidase S41 [Fibrella aestuarina BUZ 2]